MQRIFPLGVYAPIRYIVLAALVLAGGLIISCKTSEKKSQKTVTAVSWNIVFKKNTDSATRELAISKIKDSLIRYYILNYPRIKPEFDSALYCPCDSLLYNLNMRFIDGSGGSVSSPPPAKPGPDGSGDYLAIQYISNNNPIQEMEPDEKPARLNRSRIPLNFYGIDTNNVLAIIDTGIDTTKFSSNVRKLLWRRPGQEKTMYNFLPRQNLYDLRDDHRLRHGTVVTAIALKALSTGGDQTIYPKIMILKALDSKKRGSVFSVSCALSYALKNNARVVNASLGYYGESDPVLYHYIKLCNSDTSNPILVFAAAGNMMVNRDTAIICKTPDSANQLTTSYTFFPASWSPQLNHVITITGLSTDSTSCYYQNYSNAFVSLGVLNKLSSHGQMHGGCCDYKVPFSDIYYEGSSFATPVGCGMLMRFMLSNNISTKQLIREIALSTAGGIIHRGTPSVTKDGKYLIFPVKIQ